jgi:hypothetical protein
MQAEIIMTDELAYCLAGISKSGNKNFEIFFAYFLT